MKGSADVPLGACVAVQSSKVFKDDRKAYTESSRVCLHGVPVCDFQCLCWCAAQDHAKWIPVATVSFQYMPEITINRGLMDTLTEQEREDWVRSSPTPVFRFNNITKQVSCLAFSPSPCIALLVCLCRACRLPNLRSKNLPNEHLSSEQFEFGRLWHKLACR